MQIRGLENFSLSVANVGHRPLSDIEEYVPLPGASFWTLGIPLFYRGRLLSDKTWPPSLWASGKCGRSLSGPRYNLRGISWEILKIAWVFFIPQRWNRSLSLTLPRDTVRRKSGDLQPRFKQVSELSPWVEFLVHSLFSTRKSYRSEDVTAGEELPWLSWYHVLSIRNANER